MKYVFDFVNYYESLPCGVLIKNDSDETIECEYAETAKEMIDFLENYKGVKKFSRNDRIILRCRNNRAFSPVQQFIFVMEDIYFLYNLYATNTRVSKEGTTEFIKQALSGVVEGPKEELVSCLEWVVKIHKEAAA